MTCAETYKGRGEIFCCNSCRVTWTNTYRNVAKRQDVKDKISEARKRIGTTMLMTPESRKKARISISKALMGRSLSSDHKRAISGGLLRSGHRPPISMRSGPRHHNWKGGTSSVRNADFKNPLYIAFRNGVLTRDKYTCQKCTVRGLGLHAHHLKSWAEYPDLRYVISNGVTLCRSCHYSEHKGKPKIKRLPLSPRTIADRLAAK